MSMEKVKILDDKWKDQVKRLLSIRDTHSGIVKNINASIGHSDSSTYKDTIDFEDIWSDEYIDKYFDPNEPYFIWGYVDNDELLCMCGVYKWKLMPRCTTTIHVSKENLGVRIMPITEDIWRKHFSWMLDNGIKQGFAFSDVETSMDALTNKSIIQKAKRKLVNNAGDGKWVIGIEEFVDKNTETKWTGFKLLTGNRKWPANMVIKNYTYIGDWLENQDN